MSCPRLEKSTIFWLVENRPRSSAVLFRLGTCQRTCEKKFLTHDFCGKFANLLQKTFFFWDRLRFTANLRKFWAKRFFLENTSALCPWSLGLEHFCPWPWERSVLGRCLLGLGFFFILGLEPCVLDSTSGKVLTVTAIKRSVFLILCCHQDFVIGRDDEGRTSGRECGAGYWNPARNPRKAQGRLIPDCTTAAMQINKNFNKTTAALFWTAPKCGCIYIRWVWQLNMHKIVGSGGSEQLYIYPVHFI